MFHLLILRTLAREGELHGVAIAESIERLSNPRGGVSAPMSWIGGIVQRRVRDGLVVTQVALAFMLAIGAATVKREVLRLHRIPPGMALREE